MHNSPHEEKIKQHICNIGKLIYDKGFVAANDGNISYRLNEDEILITPTGVSKGFLQPQEIVKVNLQGEVLSEGLKPSSEMKMHLKVYMERPDMKAVVHTHPPYATAHAIAGLSLNQATMPEAVVLLGTIPLAEYGTPSTEEIPNAIAKYVHQHRGVLLENHGALTWGEDLDTAFYVMESLEFCAKINWIARQMNGLRELSAARVAELIQIKKKMGIQGNSPPGLPCPDQVSVCRSERQHEILLSEDQLNIIVARVAEAVVNQLDKK